MREGMSPGAGAKKRLGVGVVGGVGFGLGCGCRDAKAVAVAASAASSASPYSATATTTDTSTATTATTWRGSRGASAPRQHHHPSSAASGSTSTLTVPSASSSSFVWEDADGDAGEDEVDCGKQRESSAAAGFSGLLRQLNELEQSVVSWGRKSTGGKDYFSPPPPPPPPPPPLPAARPVKQRAVLTADDKKEGHGDFSVPLPPPPPLPAAARPVKQRGVQSGGDSKEGHGNFSPPPPAPTTSLQLQLLTTQQHRKATNMDEAKQPEPPPPPPPLPLPPEQPKPKSMDNKGGKKEDVVVNISPASQQAAPKHRKAKSCDGGKVRLVDGSVAVVKQSEDPLSDFRRSMVNMVVENRIATGDELRELLRHFLALNAPHHHDAILRAFTEIWDEAFSAIAKTTTTPHREPARRPTPPRPRTKAPTTTPPRRRPHAPTPPRVWR